MSAGTRVVFVSGAASGIGRLAARNAAADGAKVAAIDVNDAGLAETADGHEIMTMNVDVTDATAVAEAVARAEKDLGPVDRCYNAAAIMMLGRLIEQDPNAIHKMMAVNYGGRTEIVEAAQKLAEAAARGTIDPASIDEAAFAGALTTAGMPDPDLMIRTSGEYRISNFLLWELAYSELLFTDTPWPEFGRNALIAAIHEYQTRDRRFGGVDTEG